MVDVTPLPAVLPEGDLSADTALTPVEGRPGRWQGHLGHQWRVAHIFGGVTLATALRAVTVAVARPDLRPVSLDATYCQAVPAGPVAVEVEILRQGRNGAQAQARLWSTDDPGSSARPDLVLTAVFGRDRQVGGSILGAEFPADAPDPAHSRGRELDPRRGGALMEVPYHRQVEWRLAVGNMPWEVEGPGEPRAVSWFRLLRPALDADGAWEPYSLAVPADVLGPAVGQGLGPDHGFFYILTLQLSVQFVEPMRGTWLAQHTRCTHAGAGFANGTAELWSEDRRLVAMATQSAMLRPFTPG